MPIFAIIFVMQHKNNFNEPWWRPAILMFTRLSVWIFIPLFIGALSGQLLDKKFNTDPWIFLICVGISFIISLFGLIKNTIKEYKKIDNIKFKNKNN